MTVHVNGNRGLEMPINVSVKGLWDVTRGLQHSTVSVIIPPTSRGCFCCLFLDCCHNFLSPNSSGLCAVQSYKTHGVAFYFHSNFQQFTMGNTIPATIYCSRALGMGLRMGLLNLKLWFWFHFCTIWLKHAIIKTATHSIIYRWHHRWPNMPSLKRPAMPLLCCCSYGEGWRFLWRLCCDIVIYVQTYSLTCIQNTLTYIQYKLTHIQKHTNMHTKRR